MKKKYRLYNNITQRYVEDDTDVDNREGYCLGQYAISPKGRVLFFENGEGGMDVYDLTDEITIEWCL